MSKSDLCLLEVNGKNYGGWKSIRITLSIEQVAGTFELSVSERWPGQPKSWPIRPGDACRVLAKNVPLITGYVDDFHPSYDARGHAVRISGRDKTADLVDCSAIYKTGDWHNATLLKITSDICSPFGIEVKSETDLGAKFKRYSLQEGETAFEAIERAARMRGVLLVSDGNGRLLLTRASSTRIETALVKGENIEIANGEFSHRERFSEYIVKGQTPGTDWSTPEQNARTKATVKDEEIKRYRPMIVHAEQGDGKVFENRAKWERSVRMGRGSRITYVVTGWEHAAGVWRPNVLVGVKDDYMGVTGDLLLAGVSLSLGEDGTHADLALCRPEAFDLLPQAEEKRRGRKKKEEMAW